MPGEKNDGIGAAVNFSVSSGDAHFPEQVLGRYSEKGLDARVLQRGEAEAPLFEGAAKTASERSADGAIAVEENPAAERVPSFCISHF